MRAVRPLLWCRSVTGCHGGRLKRVLQGLFALVVVAGTAGAQSSIIAGIVVDSAGLPVSGAEVSVSVIGATTISGDLGEFRISAPSSGSVVVRARRLGFRRDSVRVTSVNGAAGIIVAVKRVAETLAPVVVRTRRTDFTGRLSGYYQRLDRKSSGYFITRAQIDGENPRTLSQLLQHAPGMTAFRGRAGTQGVRMRGRRCWPLVWLDGTPMPSGEFDLDGVPPNTLHGIELYLGSTTAPTRYSGNRDLSSCGTILLWSRGPDTDPIAARRAPVNLESLVASLAVYTADQVDDAATVAPGNSIEVVYPPALFAEKLAGTVVAEFVVDGQGRVEPETFGVVSSTNRLFTEAVRKALETAVFTPATRAGRAVRQIVHQPFTFTPPVANEAGR